jgi:NADP-dependent 3-hydroxy acid dehydrogenase YdfG
MAQLGGKTALVTGGGSGIGAGIALALAAEGYRVAIAGRREDKLRETARQFTGEPAILLQSVDVADRASVNRLFAWATEQLGDIDILVNAAGINIQRRSMEAMSPEEWDHVMAVNATGVYNCMHAALPSMRRRGAGLIVNISSIAGKRASALGGVAYCASKFAVTALGTAVGLEVARQGVRVTNIYPGEVDTPILDQRPTPVTHEHRARILQPQDVAATVLMIAALPPRAHVPELVIKPTWQEYA